MKKRVKKHLISAVLALILAVTVLPMPDTQAAAACSTYTGDNLNDQNYSRWSATVKSYLLPQTGGALMRVQAGGDINGMAVEYFDASYKLTASRTIAPELPIFGGFYAAADAYYVVTGQKNTAEEATVEVFRITKYDKNWNRIGSTGLYDCNTTVPFDAGSLRMDMCGKYLMIRTSHEMYTNPKDGLNHQANVTIQVDTETMTITDSYTDVMNSGYGYVSHSFNQFIKMDGGQIAALDHGDAHPRSLVLLLYNTDATTGKFVPDYYTQCTAVDVMTFATANNYNITGATAGGFELSSSSYLMAGNSVVQESILDSRKTRNVFVAAVDKTSHAVTTNWLTSYVEGEESTTTPHMVKITDDRFVVLWSRGDKVYYTEVNGRGQKVGAVYEQTGALSDCVPVVNNGKLVWYTWKDGKVTFYEINLSDYTSFHVTECQTGHDYQPTGTVTNGEVTLKCTKCQDTKNIAVPTAFSLYWNETDGSGSYWSSCSKSYDKGKKLYYLISSITTSSSLTEFNKEVEIISSDSSIISVNETSSTMGYFEMLKPGTATITIRPKLNPGIAKTYNFTVTAPLEFESFETSAPSAEYSLPVTLTASARYGKGTYQYRFYMKDSAGTETVLRDFGTEASVTWTPDFLGTVTLCVDIKDNESTVTSSIENYVVGKAQNVPNAPAPEQSAAVSVKKLGEIALPEGWSWETDGETALKPGVPVEAVAIYEDTENYVNYRITITVTREICQHVNTEIVNAVKETCTTDGYTGDTECNDCLETISVGNVIPAPGHDWDEGVITEEATDTEAGLKTFTCIVCTEQRTETYRKEKGVIETLPEASAITYGDALGSSELTGGSVKYGEGGKTVPGTFAWANPSVKPQVKDSDVTEYEILFTPEDSANYARVSAVLTLTVHPMENVPNTPESEMLVPYTVTKLGEVTLPEGWSWETDVETALEQGTPVEASAVYKDTENYVNYRVAVTVTRDICRHSSTRILNAVKETCTTDGYTGDIQCIDCLEMVSMGTAIPAPGHDWDDGEITEEATDTEAGIKTFTCIVCEKQRTETYIKEKGVIETLPEVSAITYGDALGSSELSGGSVKYGEEGKTVAGTFVWVNPSVKPQVKDSDETEYEIIFTPDDTGNYTCVKATLTLTVLPMEDVPNAPAAEQKVSYSVKTLGEVSLPEGWTWETDAETELEPGKTVEAVTVYEDAENYVNHTITVSVTRDICHHASKEVRGVRKATCTRAGYTGDTYCKVCGQKVASGKAVSAPDHKWNSGVVVRKPTITATGIRKYTCLTCKISKNVTIAKLSPANWLNQTVTVGDCIYKVTKAGRKPELALTGYLKKKATTVVVPATVKINGVTCKVTSIGPKAFAKMTRLTNVTIGKNVTGIGKNAFYGCKKLKHIEIKAAKLAKVEKSAISGISKKAVIQVPRKKVEAYKKLFTAKTGYKKTMKITK